MFNNFIFFQLHYLFIKYQVCIKFVYDSRIKSCKSERDVNQVLTRYLKIWYILKVLDFIHFRQKGPTSQLKEQQVGYKAAKYVSLVTY